MIYDRFIIEEPPKDPDEALRLHNQVWDLAVNVSLDCGEVIERHHRSRPQTCPPCSQAIWVSVQVLEALKNGLDTHNILNPGKMGFGPPA